MGARRVAAVLLLASGLSAALAPAGAQAACTRATNIEAIIDDSGSMSLTDANRLRVQAMDLLINALDPGTTLGSIEFGGQLFSDDPPAADVVFTPEAVGPNASAMKAALDQKIQADNGLTDYNAAFQTSDAANPAAGARIFLTDGGHDAGDYTNAHLAMKIPTYVIGFGAGVGDPADQARLQQIASDTGGKYFPLPDSSALQAVMDQIEAALDCQAAPVSFTDQLAQGTSAVHKLAIAKNVKDVRIALTWSSPLDRFAITGVRVRRGKHTVAAARVRKLKITRSGSSTFVLVTVSRLVRGTLTFKVRATKVGSGAPKAKLTTQVSRRH